MSNLVNIPNCRPTMYCQHRKKLIALPVLVEDIDTIFHCEKTYTIGAQFSKCNRLWASAVYLDSTFLECLCLFHLKTVSPKKIPLLPNRTLLVMFTYICTDHSPKLFPWMVLANSQTYRIRLHNSLCLNWLILIRIAAFYNVLFYFICVCIHKKSRYCILYQVKLSKQNLCVWRGYLYQVLSVHCV